MDISVSFICYSKGTAVGTQRAIFVPELVPVFVNGLLTPNGQFPLSEANTFQRSFRPYRLTEEQAIAAATFRVPLGASRNHLRAVLCEKLSQYYNTLYRNHVSLPDHVPAAWLKNTTFNYGLPYSTENIELEEPVLTVAFEIEHYVPGFYERCLPRMAPAIAILSSISLFYMFFAEYVFASSMGMLIAPFMAGLCFLLFLFKSFDAAKQMYDLGCDLDRWRKGDYPKRVGRFSPLRTLFSLIAFVVTLGIATHESMESFSTSLKALKNTAGRNVRNLWIMRVITGISTFAGISAAIACLVGMGSSLANRLGWTYLQTNFRLADTDLNRVAPFTAMPYPIPTNAAEPPPYHVQQALRFHIEGTVNVPQMLPHEPNTIPAYCPQLEIRVGTP